MNEQTYTIEELKPSVIQAEIPEGPCVLRNPQTLAEEQDNIPVPVKRINGPTVEEDQDERKSRIPVSRFRQAVDKIKNPETQDSERPPQPRLRKNVPGAVKSDHTLDIEKLKNRNTVDDFERLFGDLSENGRASYNSDILKEISPADPNLIDNYFEQIIKTYKDVKPVEKDVSNGVNELETPVQKPVLNTPTVLENFDDVLNTYVEENGLQSSEKTTVVNDAETVRVDTNSNDHEVAENVGIVEETVPEVAEIKLQETVKTVSNNNDVTGNILKDSVIVKEPEIKIKETIKIATIVNNNVVSIGKNSPEESTNRQDPVVDLMEPVRIAENTETPIAVIENKPIVETVKVDNIIIEEALHPKNIIKPEDTNKFEKVQVVDTFVPLPAQIAPESKQEEEIEPLIVCDKGKHIYGPGEIPVDTYPVNTEQVEIFDILDVPMEVNVNPNQIEQIDIHPDVLDPVPNVQPGKVDTINNVQTIDDIAVAPVEIVNVANDVKIIEEIAVSPVEIISQPGDVKTVEIITIEQGVAEDIIAPVEIINVEDNLKNVEELAIAPVEKVPQPGENVINIDQQSAEEIVAPIEIVNVEDNLKIVDEIAIEPVNAKPVKEKPDEVQVHPGEVEPISIQPDVAQEVRYDNEKEIDENEMYEQKSVSEIVKIFEGIKMETPQSRIPRRFNRNIKVYPMLDDDMGRRIEPKTPVPDDVLKIRSIFKTMKSIENEHLARESENLSGKPEIIGVIKKNPAVKQGDLRKYKSMPSIDKSDVKRTKSRAELDLGSTVKGRVEFMINKINSIDVNKNYKSYKPMEKKQSVFNRIAVFEQRKMPIESSKILQTKQENTPDEPVRTKEELQAQIEALKYAKRDYGSISFMPTMKLSDGAEMPVMTVGTAVLDPELVKYVIMAAIDLGYRSIDSAFIYGNEKLIGEGIRAKIEDGTVKREDLFIINKLWSTFHRGDLVEVACRSSLETMGLDYFDLYLIHNPMSFKEGKEVIPKIANVLQFSTSDYLDAWRSMELLLKKNLVRSIGVSNFNSQQIARVYEKAARKPVINQIESHPYLNQLRLDEFCAIRDIKLSCYATLGTKGTPDEYKTSNMAVIDDPLIKVIAAAAEKTPAQMLIRYQLDHDRNVVVKSSSPLHLWENLQALNFKLKTEEIDAINALNKNKRYFNFKGMGDAHKNYPFTIPF